MKLLYNALRQYVDFSLSPHELKDFLEDSGIEVEEFRDLSEGLRGKVFVGVVEKIVREDGALKVLLVDVGPVGSFQVVTTSPIREGDRVVYAAPGAILPDGTEIRKREIRGYASEGMLLSEEELGLADKSDEVIRHLPPELPPGSDPLPYLRLNDYLYDLYITPNRPDLLGVLGIAYEVAFLHGGEVRLPDIFEGMDEDFRFPIEIADDEGCPRYTGRVIRNVKVGRSPDWLRYTLNLVGFRDINNVVDITNYVLWETGHPLHAFDLDRLKEKILVRRANKGEKILTLDGVERELDEDILVIADAQVPVAVAGVIGGELTSVGDDTTTILLESAYFHPPLIARASRKLKVKTESSRRFERGADVEMAPFASHRATHLIRWLAGGKSGPLMDVYPRRIERRVVHVDPDRIIGFLGSDEIDRETVRKALVRMGAREIESWKFEIPSRRRDVEHWQDISEEVARFAGYSSIPDDTTALISDVGDRNRTIYEEAVDFLVGRGYYEAKTYSFISPDRAERFYPEPMRLANPLSEELSTLRPYVISSLLMALSENLRKSLTGARLVEWGSAFRDGESIEMGMVLGGRRRPQYGQPEQYDYFDLKGDVEALLDYLGLDYEFEPHDYPFFRVGARILSGGKEIGFIGEIKRSIARLYDIKQTVYAARLTLEGRPPTRLKDISRFPPVFRDVSFVARADIPYSEIERIIRSIAEGIPYLDEVILIDRYEGEPIKEGFVSYTFRLKFVSHERSLTDQEVAEAFGKFVESLKSRGLKLRS